MSDLRAQNLALYALLHGLKPTCSRFDLAREVLAEAVADLVEEGAHPFFSALRADLKEKVIKLGVEKACENYHLSPMLAELLVLSGESEVERATECTGSPEDLTERNPLRDFDSPQKDTLKDLPESPKASPSDCHAPSPQPSPSSEPSLSSESDLASLCKRSFKVRLQRAVEWYKQGVSVELLADKLKISNKYKIHMCGNWSQLPPEKIAELGKMQCTINQLCERKYTLPQIEHVFQSHPRSLIKVMYETTSPSCSKKRKLQDLPS
jgi:hypothetical protein